MPSIGPVRNAQIRNRRARERASQDAIRADRDQLRDQVRLRDHEIDRLWDELRKMERRLYAQMHPLANMRWPMRFQGPRPPLGSSPEKQI